MTWLLFSSVPDHFGFNTILWLGLFSSWLNIVYPQSLSGYLLCSTLRCHTIINRELCRDNPPLREDSVSRNLFCETCCVHISVLLKVREQTALSLVILSSWRFSYHSVSFEDSSATLHPRAVESHSSKKIIINRWRSSNKKKFTCSSCGFIGKGDLIIWGACGGI